MGLLSGFRTRRRCFHHDLATESSFIVTIRPWWRAWFGKPLQCSSCGKRFAKADCVHHSGTTSYVERGMQMHGGGMFRCSVCGRRWVLMPTSTPWGI